MLNIFKKKRRIWAIAIIALLIGGPAIAYVVVYPWFIKNEYQPRRGDILFQSLPKSDLVEAIEGISGSPFSHCGIVIKKEGRWFVREAIGGVLDTELYHWIWRGRKYKFAAYRLRKEHAENMDAFLEASNDYLGRPYDIRYRMDDEFIYCSELVFKAYQDATGDALGELKDLRKMNWKPFAKTIEYYEGGPVPEKRMMITPKHLAEASQLREVFNNGISD